MELQTAKTTLDQREALFNGREIGPASHIQKPREAVTRLWGLMIDLDADLLAPNPWFPPGDDAAAFHKAIEPSLNRHPFLRDAEVRDTGRWLHALVWFKEPVELRSAKDQKTWTAVHQVLAGSVPSDPRAPVLIGLTRPVESVNTKTGNRVRVLKAGTKISADSLQEWCDEVRRRPFKEVGTILFGDSVIAPCPYCGSENSRLELGDHVGFCYSACRYVRLDRLHDPFRKTSSADRSTSARGQKPLKRSANEKNSSLPRDADVDASPVTFTGGENGGVLEIDPSVLGSLVIKVKNAKGSKKD